jgi:histone acetyltransferase (RNA polymerase elongator complex component)
MTETEARLNSHEAVCVERYEQINARLKRLERIIMNSAGVLLLGMGGVIWTFISHVPR